MKKGGLIHPELLRVLAELGHGDLLVVADAGLPIPAQARRIDLGFIPGMPPFLKVLGALLDEVVLEEVILAEEIKVFAPADFRDALLHLLEQHVGERIRFIPHRELKRLQHEAKGIVRTGEFTPYANAVLVSGVPF